MPKIVFVGRMGWLVANTNEVAGSKTVTCSLVTDRQTHKQTKKAMNREALSGLSELPPFSPSSWSGLKKAHKNKTSGDMCSPQDHIFKKLGSWAIGCVILF